MALPIATAALDSQAEGMALMCASLGLGLMPKQGNTRIA